MASSTLGGAGLAGLGVALALDAVRAPVLEGRLFSRTPLWLLGFARRVEVQAEEYYDSGMVIEKAEVGNELGRSLTGLLTEQLSVGAVLGYCTGYFVKRAGRVAMAFIGAQIVALQYMAMKEWVVVDWSRMANDLAPSLNRSLFRAFVDLVTYRLPFSTSFTAGLYYALRSTK